MTPDLFEDQDEGLPAREALGPGAFLLRGYARQVAPQLLQAIHAIGSAAPFRHMCVPGGKRMSVAMTNCGELGWCANAQSYHYASLDPLSGQAWPAMPKLWRTLAKRAAQEMGFDAFEPQACLINRYEPGARMGLHQDRDETALLAPIVSISLGLPAIFLWGGPRREDPTRRLRLVHGDVLVWGGPARLHHHGVMALPKGFHGLTGALRFNLTFRQVHVNKPPG